MSGGLNLDACRICPPRKRLFCWKPCTPEIAEAYAKVHQEAEFRFAPPVRPSREIKPFFRDEKMPRRMLRSPESPNKLR